MSRTLKIAAGAVVAIAVLVVLAIFLLVSNLGTIVEAAIEKFGSEVAGTRVTLGGAEVSATSGEGSLADLRIGNPAGFGTGLAFRLGAVSIRIDTATLTADVVVVPEIAVDALEVTWEGGPDGSNLDAIRRNVDAWMAANTSGDGGGASDGRRLIIDNLYIRDGTVRAGIIGGETQDLPLPDIHMTGIGRDSGGASPGEVAAMIFDSVAGNVTRAVASSGLEGVGEIPGEGAGAVRDMAEEGTEGVGRVIDSITGNDRGAPPDRRAQPARSKATRKNV